MKNRNIAAFLAASVLGLSAAQVASAADLPRKAPMAAPIVAPVYNWTGFYIGVHGGWVWSDTDATTSYAPVGFFDAFSYSHDADGGMLGGQIGFNYQIANWVIGLEADLSWVDVGSTATVAPLTLVGVPQVGSFHTSAVDMNWFGTVRGRLGFTANTLLVYVTGGFAFADLEHAVVTADPLITGFAAAGTASDTRAGWTIGGGFEWGFAPNWSIKGEYLYYDLGDTTLTVTDPILLVSSTTNFENTGHIFRVGLNYRFGWAGSPVVARY
jgi:outer membrane immunogenic protein